MITKENYLEWHEKLKADGIFRLFWVFCGIYIVGFFYAGILLFLIPSRRTMAALAFIAFILTSLVVCKIIKYFYKRQRPYQRWNFNPPASRMLLSWLHDKFDSFPSSHAASLAAISTVCFIFFPLLGLLGFIAAFINGIARVILGYHHPSDIIAGWLIGVLTGYLTYFLLFSRLFTS